jgi:DNA processing protein
MPSSWRPHARSACSTTSGTQNPDAWLCLLSAAADGGRWLDALKAAGSAEALLAADRSLLRRSGLDLEEIARLRSCRASVPDQWRRWLGEPDHALIGFGSPLYPERLAAIVDPPLALWADGSHPALLAEPQLAIVGSRHATRNGETTAESFAFELSRLGLVVTSGLATGIDAAGHRGALAGGAGTIAVTGGGIDCIYPSRNRALAEAIRAEGLIVSEYAPGHPVRAFQFPLRNRIIAALSLGTLVVEATRRSGSLITARLAAEYGREIFAVPGSIHHAQSKGCHKLLRDGAKLVENVNDILVEIAPQLTVAAGSAERDASRANIEMLPAPLAKILDYSPIGFDALVAATGLTAAELSSMLLHLEIQGTIEALPGGRYCRLAERAG